MIRTIANNQIFKNVSTIVEIMITVSLVVLIVLTGMQRFSNKGSFFGYRIFTVASGSMIPMYEIGDTLLVKNVPIEDITIGDAVTYQTSLTNGQRVNITHEVIDVEQDEMGKYAFHTKGIANNVEDPIVGEDQVVGKVVHRFILLSILGYITVSKTLMLLVITLPLGVLVAIEIIKLLYDDERQKVKSLRGVKEKTLNKSEIKVLEKDSHILTEEERQRKIEAIRNGTNTVNLDKKKNEEHKILSVDEMERKIEKIKHSHVTDRASEEKLISDIIKEDSKEEINFDSISDIEQTEKEEDNKKETIQIDDKEIVDTVTKIKEKNLEDTSEEEIDEFLRYMKEKLMEERKVNKDKEE